MKPVRDTTATIVFSWFVGAFLFGMPLAYAVSEGARFWDSVGIPTWFDIFAGMPWWLVWIVFASILAFMAAGFARLARARAWVSYAYPALVVAVLALSAWAIYAPPGVSFKPF
jgi:hypothetical protein